MRQRLDLFIDGLLADTDGDSLVLFNYALEDLQKPTVVKNSFSRQITLKATRRNNRIFQSCFRMDRVIGSGFDPRKRVPFQILADGARLVEAGYLKLDGTQNTEHANFYKVTLFGGLGSFFFTLAYNGENKRTLADLDFLGTEDPDSELDFTINANAVRTAWYYYKLNWDNGVWQRSFPGLSYWWQVIQFAPAYNGKPENFDAAHALAVAAKTGLQTSVTIGEGDDAKTYETKDGYTLVDLGQDLTEWQVCDLRAYMQRPVVSVYAIIDAIVREAAKHGYTVKLDDAFFKASNPYYLRAWMALPMLTDIVKDDVSYSGQTFTLHGTSLINPTNSTISRRAMSIPHGTTPAVQNLPDLVYLATGYRPTAADQVIANIPFTFLPSINYSIIPVGSYQLRMSCANQEGNGIGRAYFVETYAVDANGNYIARGPVKCFTSPYFIGETEYRPSMDEIVQGSNYVPYFNDALPDVEYGSVSYGRYVVRKTEDGLRDNIAWDGDQLIASVSARGAAKIEIFIHIVTWIIGVGDGDIAPFGGLKGLHPNRNTPTAYIMYTNGIALASYGNYEVVADGATRSDTLIKKKDILSLAMTPADFLLYYSRRFGLIFRTDTDGKTIHIETRNTFFKNETYDIDDRIAVNRGNEVNPLPFDARILQMQEETIGSAYPEKYARVHGRPYGAKRLHTEYEFNADVKDLFEKSCFKTAAEVMKQDKTFVTLRDNSDTANPFQIPSCFLLGGMKYQLYLPTGLESTELAVPGVPDAAQMIYYNTFLGYDRNSRAEFEDEDGKPVDGTGVLLFMQGFTTAAPGTAVTDDNALMYSLADGPCWYLDPADSGLEVPTLPMFGRYIWDLETRKRSVIRKSMDFGTPAEIDIPGIAVEDGSDVYAKFWDNYISDRYNKDTKTVTLYISTRGLPMSLEQMRPFFWFRGSLWSLNKIIDYDLTGDGITKCEFVQVQDRANYRKLENF